jgi:hypothetical protein
MALVPGVLHTARRLSAHRSGTWHHNESFHNTGLRSQNFLQTVTFSLPMSVAKGLDNGTRQDATAKQPWLKPPYAPGRQLTAAHAARSTSTCDIIVERERLKKVVCEETLERMHVRLWYAGRKGNISPLHHQKVIHREIILTERPRLHLVWYGRIIYIQRLDDELLNWDYFSGVVCGDNVTHQAATGFLLSYARLVEYPSDLDLAQALGLINRSISWSSWRNFRADVLHHLAGRDIHDRYEYGELRLSRLNQIYRMQGLGLNYFNVHREYSSYFGDNYMALIAVFALVSVALAAMQVMTSVDSAPAEVAITSYQFSIATLVALAGSCAALLALYAGLYVWNWVLILIRHYSRQL